MQASHSLVFLDDVIVWSSTVAGLLHNLELVFAKLMEINVRVKPSKCHDKKYARTNRRVSSYKVGQSVLIPSPRGPSGRRKGLDPKYEGPYTILKVLSPRAVVVDKPRGGHQFRAIAVRRIKPYHQKGDVPHLTRQTAAQVSKPIVRRTRKKRRVRSDSAEITDGSEDDEMPPSGGAFSNISADGGADSEGSVRSVCRINTPAERKVKNEVGDTEAAPPVSTPSHIGSDSSSDEDDSEYERRLFQNMTGKNVVLEPEEDQDHESSFPSDLSTADESSDNEHSSKAVYSTQPVSSSVPVSSEPTALERASSSTPHPGTSTTTPRMMSSRIWKRARQKLQGSKYGHLFTNPDDWDFSAADADADADASPSQSSQV